MRSDREFMQLIEEFPELADENIILEKELYAHFGLLFFTFALVEHSLVNFAVFDTVGRGIHSKTIKNKTDWENTFDKSYEKAKSLSLGNLIKSVALIPETESELPNISRMKSERDYFAHHFFRDEIVYFHNDERGWSLLVKLQDVRRRAHNIEESLKTKFELMHRRYGLPKPAQEQLNALLSEYENDAMKTVAEGTVKFGWES